MAKKDTSALAPSASNGLIAASDFAASLDDGGFSVVRDFKFEVDGPGLHGFFQGEGGSVEMVDDKTGEIKTVRTWQIKDVKSNILWQCMGSHGLEKYIAKCAAGDEVMIKLIGQKEVGKGRRMNDYVVGIKKARASA